MNKNNAQSTVDSRQHVTVLLDETVDGLQLKQGDTAIDATVGMGGHAARLAETLGAGTLVVIDTDEVSLAAAKEQLAGCATHVIYLHGNFRNLAQLAKGAGISAADGIVFDLGWHAGQLTGKGMSFLTDEPLDMRLASGRGGRTAADIIADWDEVEIARILREYGEERFAGRIARVIVETRDRKPITTTTELATVVASAVPAFARRSKRNPATRTFQALRIAVNDELAALSEGLDAALTLLAPGGRIAVISFHSLEDRIVKRAFRAAEERGVGERVTKKPITPSLDERTTNRRARSAKLRIFKKYAP